MLVELNEDFDELLVIEDVDIGDESELRKVVAVIEGLVGMSGKGLRVSVLTTEQWQTVVKRSLPKTLRKGAELYYHMLRDPHDPGHLLISPSAVRGINEGSRQMYQELVYTVLRCIPTAASDSLRKGIDDVIAGECGKRIGVELYVRTYPRHSELVKCIIRVLSRDFGYAPIDWAVVLRKDPNRVLLALTRSDFHDEWVRAGNRNNLFELLTAKRVDVSSDEVLAFENAVKQYLEDTEPDV